MDACGPTANYHTWELSDGTRITISSVQLASPVHAAQELENQLSHATGIIERAVNLDGLGQPAGNTVVAKTDRGVISIETQGSRICIIKAASLEHLHWYQRQ